MGSVVLKSSFTKEERGGGDVILIISEIVVKFLKGMISLVVVNRSQERGSKPSPSANV